MRRRHGCSFYAGHLSSYLPLLYSPSPLPSVLLPGWLLHMNWKPLPFQHVTPSGCVQFWEAISSWWPSLCARKPSSYVFPLLIVILFGRRGGKRREMVSARAAITKYIDWVFFEQQKFILSHFWRPESPTSRFLQGLVPGESSLFGLQTAAFFCVSFLFFIRTLALLD